MSNLIIDEAFHYDEKVVSHPSYKPTRIFSKNGTSATLTTSTTPEFTFEITPRCMNLSKSTLDFQLQYIAGVTGANHYENFLTLGQVYISYITLKTNEGTSLVSLDNVDMITRAEALYINKMEKFLSNPRNSGSTTSQLANGVDLGWNVFRSNNLASLLSAVGNTPPYSGGKSIPITTSPGGQSNGFDNYNEAQYFIQVANLTNGAGNFYRNFSIPLSEIAPHTLLSINKTLYFGQSLYLTIGFSPTNKLGWISDINNGNNANLDGTFIIANLELRLKVEKNQTIVKTLVDKVNKEGLSLTIPFSYQYTNLITNGTVASTHLQRYTRAHGKKLLNIYTFISTNTTAGNLASDISNRPSPISNDGSSTLGAAKVLTTNPFLNSVPLNEYVLQEYNNNTYEIIRDMIKGSAIGNVDVWRYNRVYPLSWRQDPSCEWIDKDCVNDGIDLDTSIEIAINYTHPSSFANSGDMRSFQVAVVQRTLTINAGGVISII